MPKNSQRPVNGSERNRTPKTDNHFDTGHLEADLKGRSIRGGAVTIAGQGVQFAIQMASTVVLARLLTPSAFGLIAMVTAVTGFAKLFKDLGLSLATVQASEISHRQISALFWVNVGVSVFISAGIAALAPAIAWFYGEPRLTSITIALAVSFVFGGLTVQHQALLSRQMRFGALTAVNVLSMLAGVAAAVVAALLGAGYWALVIKELAMALGMAIGVWIASSWRPGLAVRGTGIREMLHFGANLTGFNIFNYFARNLDNILIGRVWGAASLGFYSKAYSLLLLPLQQINAPLSAVAVPTLSRLQEDAPRYRSFYVKTITFITLLTMPGMLFLAIMADEVFLILLGPQWMEAARIFAVLGIVGIVTPISNSTGWLFVSQGRTREMFRWGIISSVKTVLAIVAGLPWGAYGVAVSYSIVSLVSMPLLLWFVGRKGPVGIGDMVRAIATPGLITLFVAIFLLALKTLAGAAGPVSLILYGLVGMVLIAGSSLLVLPGGRRIRREGVDISQHLFRRRKRGRAVHPDRPE